MSTCRLSPETTSIHKFVRSYNIMPDRSQPKAVLLVQSPPVPDYAHSPAGAANPIEWDTDSTLILKWKRIDGSQYIPCYFPM